jgi:hypothetical protein
MAEMSLQRSFNLAGELSKTRTPWGFLAVAVFLILVIFGSCVVYVNQLPIHDMYKFAFMVGVVVVLTGLLFLIFSGFFKSWPTVVPAPRQPATAENRFKVMHDAATRKEAED